MSRFMTETLEDMRRGRQSWRVFLALCTTSFALTIGAVTLQRLV